MIANFDATFLTFVGHIEPLASLDSLHPSLLFSAVCLACCKKDTCRAEKTFASLDSWRSCTSFLTENNTHRSSDNTDGLDK